MNPPFAYAAFLAMGGILHAQGTLDHHAAPAPIGPGLVQVGGHIGLHQGAVLFEDFTGDGAPDLIASAVGETSLRLFWNDGSGVLRRRARALPPCPPGSFVSGDVDSDGDRDLIGGGNGELFRNQGNGNFVKDANPLPGNPVVEALGDLDGDGHLDGLAWQGSTLEFLRNDGNGNFSVAGGFIPSMSGGKVVLGDVDGDGDLDVFLPAWGQTALLQNDGSGGLTEITAGLPVDVDRTFGLALGDFNGDSSLDAVLANDGHNVLWIGQGNGAFTLPASAFPSIDVETGDVLVLDVNLDGRSDIYFVNVEENDGSGIRGSADRLLLGQGGALFTDGSTGLPSLIDASSAAFARDLDRDGDLDILLTGDETRLLLSDGTGSFVHADGGVPPRWGQSDDVALADVNGDRHLDAIVAGGGYPGALQTSRLYLGDGTSKFTDVSSRLNITFNPPPLASAVAVGDVDADGDVDLVFAGAHYTRFGYDLNRLMLNDGTGDFSDVTGSQLPLPANLVGNTVAVQLGDMDGDQDLDIVFGNIDDFDGHGAGLLVFMNDGAGVFTEFNTGLGAILENDGVEDFDLVDIDGDSDLDVVARLEFFGVTILTNQSGSLVDERHKLPRSFGASDDMIWTAVADFDGDGAPDIAGAGRGTRAGGPGLLHFLYLNDGGGSFIDATAQLPASIVSLDSFGSSTTAAEQYTAVDLDDDGDVDLVGYEWVYENLGQGRFAGGSQRVLAPADVRAAAYADLDEDGDIDAFWGRTNQDAVGSNPLRHLSARGIPRLGKRLSFELFGPSAEGYLLGFSLIRTRQLTSFGFLQLGPYSIATVGIMGADGRSVWRRKVPAAPALAGTVVYWQALVGTTRATLTNLEVTKLTTY